MKQFDLVGSDNLNLDGLGYAKFIGVIRNIINDTYNICVITSYHGNGPAWFVGDTIALKKHEFISANNILFPTHIPGHTVLGRGNAYDDGNERGTRIADLPRFDKLIGHLRNTVDINDPTNMSDEIINFMKTNNYSERFFLQGAKNKK